MCWLYFRTTAVDSSIVCVWLPCFSLPTMASSGACVYICSISEPRQWTAPLCVSDCPILAFQQWTDLQPMCVRAQFQNHNIAAPLHPIVIALQQWLACVWFIVFQLYLCVGLHTVQHTDLQGPPNTHTHFQIDLFPIEHFKLSVGLVYQWNPSFSFPLIIRLN